MPYLWNNESRSFWVLSTTLVLFFLILLSTPATSIHHMKQTPQFRPHHLVQRASNVPLVVTNYCREDIYPGIGTQNGDGPASTGFLLQPGSQKTQSVSSDWQGRVWGRTNCSFNNAGTAPANGGGVACGTGDCGGIVNCRGTVSGVACSSKCPTYTQS